MHWKYAVGNMLSILFHYTALPFVTQLAGPVFGVIYGFFSCVLYDTRADIIGIFVLIAQSGKSDRRVAAFRQQLFPGAGLAEAAPAAAVGPQKGKRCPEKDVPAGYMGCCSAVMLCWQYKNAVVSGYTLDRKDCEKSDDKL